LKKEVWNSGSLICEKYYAGSFVYNNEGIEYILFDEGRLTPKADGTYQYEYFLKDHLGNTRVVFTGQEEVLAVLQESHYYPFGMEFMGVGGEQMDVTNYYKYNGKELQDDGFDLDENGVYESRLLWYDYGFRFFDPAIGRWHVPDPLAENHYDNTPFNYVLNNPLRFIDPIGLDTNVYIFDQAQRPADDGTDENTYTAEIYVTDNDDNVIGVYDGSSYPNSVETVGDNSPAGNTVNEGPHKYNNSSGHDGGTEKGLNLVDSDGNRANIPGTTPDGNETTMTVVNVHEGTSNNGNYNSRGSLGCPTIKPTDAESFFNNFDWSGANGTTGNTSGTVFIYKGDSGKAAKDRLARKAYEKVIGDLFTPQSW